MNPGAPNVGVTAFSAHQLCNCQDTLSQFEKKWERDLELLVLFYFYA